MTSLKSLVLLLLTGLLPLASADGLNARARGAGKLYFGTAISTTVLGDSAANAIGKNGEDFGSYTCENEMKFDALEPTRGTFSYANADRIVAQAVANGQATYFRCHNLVWHSQLPSWVTSGNFDNATLISIMRNHIANAVGHFKGKCFAWDVVNEGLNEDGSLRQSVWYTTIGPSYIPMAFAAASAADPAAKLYYNDYNCDRPGAKSTGAQNLIRMVRTYGAPIHGMGMQAHLQTGQVSQSAMTSNAQAFAALGVDVAYTELDIRTPDASPDAGTLAQQATDYAAVVNACKAVPRCVGISIWGFTDKYTWISGSAPLPWNAALAKKPAYNAILGAWGTSTAGGGTQTTMTTVVAQPTQTSGGGGGGCTAAHWAQCGGSGYTGCTTCAAPYTCQAQNQWYSQCL